MVTRLQDGHLVLVDYGQTVVSVKLTSEEKSLSNKNSTQHHQLPETIYPDPPNQFAK